MFGGDAHIHSKTVSATVTRSSASLRGGLFVYKLSGILVSCHESTYDLLFCLQVAWVFFLPPSHPDGCFLKQSAGPSGVFSISPAVCHAGRRVVNLAGVCAWL